MLGIAVGRGGLLPGFGWCLFDLVGRCAAGCFNLVGGFGVAGLVWMCCVDVIC